MAVERQTALGDELFGTPLGSAKSDLPVDASSDLDTIQVESEAQPLPRQEKQFRIANRVRSKLHNLPDPANPPLGYVPGKGFDAVFPFIKLPDLAPDLNGDWVQFGSPELEPNRLYYGDNLHVLRTLPSNSIDLIYIDPPFFSDAVYNVIWGDDNEVRTFSDIWDGGLPTYLIWLNARLWEMRRLLKETGSIYVHCDWHASHYIKAELDKIFGYDNFRNEIVWQRTSARSAATGYNNIHDIILYYGKSGSSVWNASFSEYDESYVKSHYGYREPDGRRYRAADITGPGRTGGPSGQPWRGYDPGAIGRHWSTTPDKLESLDAAGLVHWPRAGGWPALKRYLDEMPGRPMQSLWTDVDPVNSQAKERLGYPTQKPEALLERIIECSSAKESVVADFFAGGGVTPSVAGRLGRRWVAVDASRIAVSVTLNRLVAGGETQSGVRSNYSRPGQSQGMLDLPSTHLRNRAIDERGVEGRTSAASQRNGWASRL